MGNPYYADDHAAYDKRRQAAASRRAAEVEYARKQANAPETIAPTGRHHRKDGK